MTIERVGLMVQLPPWMSGLTVGVVVAAPAAGASVTAQAVAPVNTAATLNDLFIFHSSLIESDLATRRSSWLATV